MSEMKKRLQRKGARKGFTLVELLIVIIIIGILAGAMMLVAGASRDSAEASKIISDLRNVKAAAMMLFTENPVGLTVTDWENLYTDPTPINKYLDRPLIAGEHHFKFEDGTVTVGEIEVTGTDDDGNPITTTEPKINDAWYLGYDLTDVRSGVKANLAKQAKTVGLYNNTDVDMTDPESDFFTGADAETVVYILVQ